MKRKLGMFLSATLLAGTIAVTLATPASAQSVCVGQGTASTGAPLTYPIVGPGKTNVSFNFGLGTGVCLPSGSLSASGTITGGLLPAPLNGAYCGHSVGNGTATGGHTFSWVSAASILVLTGEVVGIVNAVPDATTGESCVSGADRFLVTGAGVLL